MGNILPLPKSVESHLNSTNINFSFYSPRSVRWIQNGASIKNDDEDIVKICEGGKSRLKNASLDLLKVHEKQKKALETFEQSTGCKSSTLEVFTSSPFITGLGSGHPTETGMILDRNTGFPYLPASSIKGVLRVAMAVNVIREARKSDPNAFANGEIPDDYELFEKYFGTTDTNNPNCKRGQLVILDAYPASYSEKLLHLDIMNPHFTKYYGGKDKEHILPIENESPIPLKFISVDVNTKFIFRYFFMPLNGAKFDEKDVEIVNNAFKTAFKEIGFGGKTAVGYGRFSEKEVSINTTSGSSTAINSEKLNQTLSEKPNIGDIVTVVVEKNFKKGSPLETYIKGNKDFKVKVNDVGKSFKKEWLVLKAEFNIKIKGTSKTNNFEFTAIASDAKSL